MSTANGKAKEGQTPSTAAGADASLALVQSTQTATNDAPDEFHGQGGLYQIIDGKRQLVADKPVTSEE
ncbi:hypothetical protein [Comamonas thiooxydans]|uniref:hypothetical protein n=1 Tax=Comamonas thiooxydans TaxID=363952 RepID=UPI000B41BCA2|nr:hypothetical protein [Comamonas thiooxydans]